MTVPALAQFVRLVLPLLGAAPSVLTINQFVFSGSGTGTDVGGGKGGVADSDVGRGSGGRWWRHAQDLPC